MKMRLRKTLGEAALPDRARRTMNFACGSPTFGLFQPNHCADCVMVWRLAMQDHLQGFGGTLVVKCPDGTRILGRDKIGVAVVIKIGRNRRPLLTREGDPIGQNLRTKVTGTDTA